jgi:hypothetical protein
MAEETVTIKLDPEQMEYIKKTYMDTLDRVIQERQAIKAKMSMLLEHGLHAWKIYRKAGDIPEHLKTLDDGWPPILGSADAGTLGYHLAAMIEYSKQVYDSIEVENEDHP